MQTVSWSVDWTAVAFLWWLSPTSVFFFLLSWVPPGSAVVASTWTALTSTACSEPVPWLCISNPASVKYKVQHQIKSCLLTRISAESQPASVVFECVCCCCCASRPRCLSVSQRVHDIGDEHLGNESRGESSPRSPPDHPRWRKVICHPVPIDSTRGCSSAVLFIGLSHQRLLPQPICVTVAW